MKTTHYLTSTILEGNRLEIDLPSVPVGQKVEVILIISELPENSSIVSENTIIDRRAFLRLPMADRGRILEQQAKKAIAYYQQNSEWQEWVDFDIAEIHDDQ